MKLSQYTQNKDNNFNLIRIVAAMSVLITHSFALAIGTGDAEPFRNALGMTIGAIAVDVFFITSGFLVTASMLTRKNVIEFSVARILRIFPALLVMLALTVFFMGLLFTSLPFTSYVFNQATLLYLVKSATLIAGVGSTLPSVFMDNPYPNAINGSLWTMPYEVRMYVLLVGIWIVLHTKKRALEQTVTVSAITSGIFLIFSHLYFGIDSPFAKLFFMFFSGSTFYFKREKIEILLPTFLISVGLLAASVLAGKQVFFVFYTLSIAYIVFCIAFIPSGRIRQFNLYGDYSYGVYIYAFPVQQSVAALIPGVSVLAMFTISLPTTLLLAILSWHLVEKRALALKQHYTNIATQFLEKRG